MSNKIESPSSVDKLGGQPLPFLARVVVYAVAWLPSVVLLVCVTPKFESLFENLQARGELPALTECVLWFAWLNGTFLLVPYALAIVLLLACDLRMAGLYRRSLKGRSLYWVWFSAVIAAGILAAGCVVSALMLPVLKMSQSI